MTNQITSNYIQKLYCSVCNFKCSKKGDYNRHLLTAKHKILTNPNEITSNYIAAYKCSCGKSYKHSSSLSKHKQNCVRILNNDITDPEDTTIIQGTSETPELVTMLVKQNQEFKELILSQNSQIIELSKNGGMNNCHNTTNNNNNFNLNLFLNNNCKDALNITDFVDALELHLNDLEQTGELGHVNGISRIFMNALNNIDETERPFHCTDSKRETVYIKDNNKWLKDDNKVKLKSAISNVTNKNAGQLTQWCEENPDCTIMSSTENTQLTEITLNSLGPPDENEYDKNNEKIAKNIMKKITISKQPA
jgi:hypothetical protein|uniref:C2H2-type domain-containing protein n=1 Tax=viral metagenome TaxID=1070528 RepID=A0A6C0IMD5_9ZZZZ